MPPQLIPVKFGQGIDTKTDPKQVTVKLAQLTNCSLQKTGSVIKRNGYVALSQSIVGGGTISAGIGLGTYKNELVHLDGKNLYTYGQSTLTPVNKGFCQPIACSFQPVLQNNGTRHDTDVTPDVAYHAASGLKCVAAFTANTISIIDAKTGASLLQQDLTDANGPGRPLKVITLGKFFVVFYQWASSPTSILFRYIATDTLTVSAAQTSLASDFDTNHPVFDATVVNGQAFLAYASTTSTHSISVYRFTAGSSSVNVSSPHLSVVEQATTCITCFGDASNNLWVAYYNGTAVKGFISDFPTDPSLANPLVLSATAIETVANVVNITGQVASTTGTFFYETSASPTYNHVIRTNTLTTGGVAGSPTILVLSLGLWSKAFSYSGDYFFFAAYGSSYQACYFLYNATQGKAVGRFYVGSGFGTKTVGSLAEVPALSGTSFITPLMVLQQSLTLGPPPVTFINYYGVNTVSVTFAPSVQMVEQANGLNITGGFLWQYDGGTVCEQGFHLFPESSSLSASGSGGNLSTGTYQYIVVYEWVDAQGQVHRSAPSVAASVSASATNSVAVTIPTLRVTQKTNVLVSLYRTTANGSIFYRVDTSLGIQINDPTNNTVSYTDTVADSVITANEQLYTTGGEVENSPGPACTAITAYKARLVLVPSETPSSWWFSKQTLTGLGLHLANTFVQNESEVGGGFNAVTQMDDKLVLIKAGNPYIVFGNGPAPNGSGNDFTPAQEIVADSGTTNPSSVLVTNDGVAFQGAKGMCLLTRSLGVQYFGADVEAYQAQSVTSAVMAPTYNQARFTLNNGTAIIHDYTFSEGRWDTFTNHNAVAACTFQGVYTFLQSNGLVLQETPGTFTDNGTNIVRTLQTGWIKLADINGFERIRRLQLLGTYISSSSVLIQVAYDYGSIVQSNTIVLNSAAGLRYLIHLAQQKCEAIQITISDASGAGEGSRWSGMTFEASVKKGLAKLPATQVYG